MAERHSESWQIRLRLVARLRLVGLIWLLLAGNIWAQGTSDFPFGGQLVIDGQRVDSGGRPSVYDFSFRAFDQADGGEPLGPTLERPGLVLDGGAFATRLDFGISPAPENPLWVETTVNRQVDGTERQIARSRRQVTHSADSRATSVRPPTSDAEILARLEEVRFVISDRQQPGSPRFLVDEPSFRRAFGVGTPVKTLDVASVGVIAASELRRENFRLGNRLGEMEVEIDRLRFRFNLTLLLLAAVVVSIFIQRRTARSGGDAVASVEEDRDPSESP